MRAYLDQVVMKVKCQYPDCLAVGNVGFLHISGEEIAPVDTSNSHSTTVIGEDLNSVLSMFNQALQNAYDA